jgi:Winged helix-turn helix
VEPVGSIRAALAERAKILLLAAEGASNTEITRQVGCSRPTVILWRQRYAQHGLAGLDDQPPRDGRKRSAPTAAPRSWPLPCRHHPSTSGSPTGPPGC